ncbi:Dihydroorotate dehydrogenase, catalytic subunit [Dehalobacter sp. UNSWDHB]|jgi:dihydroorotate dehydrogenase (subfamily 1) family protein|uniref:dihydroorotate dehydrogenase n=1 Tax=unclassified Dehalobacter TaxID=2635733 RepID=UPI00028B3113|nr:MULTISPECIES: dihydroorotate dehydrogenase [unclassified Dehalobacter]AFV02477.1 Dihydroorotate dehydrogenase, catalytic subunit [Dehalobacter sp. DCA]AFV05467.1 Dihydroorotate dehydrogenase, catalytic subunit [Dehalobacter sp. CF]EQB22397.1 Dihydroorotate dehydrogenase, catalytic subunit [Dehalobacter sp. UNSWDHB]
MQTFNLETDLAGLKLKNPVITASGTYGFGETYAPFYEPSVLGGITVKGITPLPRLGNPVPRLAETPSGLLNSVGLENPGLEAFLKNYLPELALLDTAVIVNISGFSLEDYALMASSFQRGCGIAALEVNISCPNIKHGGMAFGTDPKSAEEVIAAVRKETDLPLIAKLSPNVTDITAMAKAVESGGADIISLINTLLGMQIDLNAQKPVLANTMGGLSGPAVRPVAVRMVYQVYQTVKLPVIGMGGILTWQDAIEFMLAGASAVSIGTANFGNPLAPVEILEGIKAYCNQRGYQSVGETVGLAHAQKG